MEGMKWVLRIAAIACAVQHARSNVFAIVDARIIGRQTSKKITGTLGDFRSNLTGNGLAGIPDSLWRYVQPIEKTLESKTSKTSKSFCSSSRAQDWKCLPIAMAVIGANCNNSESARSTFAKACAVDSQNAAFSFQTSYKLADDMSSFDETKCFDNYRYLCFTFGGTLKNDDMYIRCGQPSMCPKTFQDQVNIGPVIL
jgi:hypothetical protein